MLMHRTDHTMRYMEATAVLVGIRWAETVEDRLAIAGYAGAHAPTDQEDYRVARLASAMRTFDRSGGKKIHRMPDWLRAA